MQTLTAKELHKLFTEVNEDVQEAMLVTTGDDCAEYIVPLTDVDFYEDQITNLYADDDHIAFEGGSPRAVAELIAEIERNK